MNFACTACGRCCSTAPETTLAEALSLGDVFVAALRYRVSRVLRGERAWVLGRTHVEPEFADMDRGAYVDATLAHLERVAVRAAREQTADVFVTISATAWSYPLRSARSAADSPKGREPTGCPALAADGRACTIHARRPRTCRTVPARYDVPDVLLSRAVRSIVERGRAEHGYECDVSASAPPLLDGDRVVDSAYAADRDAALAAIAAERALHERLLGAPGLPPLSEVLRAAAQAMEISVSFPAVVPQAIASGLVDAAAARAFVEQQRALLDREIAAALARKNASEREWTQRFRKLAASYESLSKSL